MAVVVAVVVAVPGAGSPPAGASAPASATTSAVRSGLLLPASSVTPETISTLPIRLQWSAVLHDTGAPVAQSSPTVADLGGTPSVVVGDQAGDVWAYTLTTGNLTGAPVTGQLRSGWPAQLGHPVTSTPSAAPDGSAVYVGAGNATHLTGGGYQAIAPDGSVRWHTTVADPPFDAAPAHAVVAGLSVGTLQGQAAVTAPSLGVSEYALSAANGAVLPGWPYPATDSSYSTPALADLYGNGRTDIVEGADQTGGFGYDQHFTTGGHLDVLNDRGGLVCHADTSQTVDSSPAVGPFLPGGGTGIVVGTGAFFSGASDSERLLAFDDHCHQVWSTALDGTTTATPALADVTGNGQLDAVEVTSNGGKPTSPDGDVSVVDAATGAVEWTAATSAPVTGLNGVVTANLGLTPTQDFQDLLVPTIGGMDIFDGRTHRLLGVLDGHTPVVAGDHLGAGTLGFQNSALVTAGATGTVGITVAGYGGTGDNGYVQHFVVHPQSSDPSPVGAGSWPEAHDNPQLTGTVGPLAPTPGCQVPAAATGGYAMAASDGGVFAMGRPFCGSMGGHPLNASIVGMATAPGTGGYWEVASDGGVFTFGGAGFYGSEGGKPLNAPIVGMAATPDGKGYWLVASDGGVFTFGDARFFGSMGGQPLNAPVVGMAATADGQGYRLVASDGGVFTFGDAQFFGSMGGQPLNAPVVGMAADLATGGYWEVASDGGIFTFDAPFYGSMGGRPLNAPVVGMAPTSSGQGYHLVASDGGIFSFGNAGFDGSMGGRPLNAPMVGMAGP